MRELLVESREITDEEGRRRVFDYAILIGEHDAGPFFCESYGVKIAEREGGSASFVPDVTTRVVKIDELMELLVRNEVLPGHLLDVVMDWL